MNFVISSSIIKEMIRVITTQHCQLCTPVKYIANRISSTLKLSFQETPCLDVALSHCIPIVTLDNKHTLFAPTPTQLSISEETLIMATNAAIKYNMLPPNDNNDNNNNDHNNNINDEITWKQLTQSFEKMTSLEGRVDKSNELTSTFQHTLQHDIDSFASTLRLTLGYFHGKDTLGVGTSMIRSSAAQALNCDINLIEASEQNTGDLAEGILNIWQHNINGNITAAAVSAPPLYIHDIANGLIELSQINGNDSNRLRNNLLSNLLLRCSTKTEMKYLIRTLQGQNKLRIGIGQSSIVGAAARAALCNVKEKVENVENVSNRNKSRNAERIGRQLYYSRHDLDRFATTLIETYKLRMTNGDKNEKEDLAHQYCLEHISPLPLTPVCAMLASPAKSINDALKYFIRIGNNTNNKQKRTMNSGDVKNQEERHVEDNTSDIVIEYKYDGERAHVHVVLDEHQTNQTTNQQNINSIQTNVYSRVGEDTSLRYFNVAQRIGQLLQQSNASIQSIILDGEMVAVDRTTSTLLPFQELTKRSRDSTTVSEHSEHNTKESERPADVCYYIFDILELNGKSLLNQTLAHRKKILDQVIVQTGDILTKNELELCQEKRITISTILSTNDEKEKVKEATETIDQEINTIARKDIQTTLEAAVNIGCEGLMVKALNGTESFYKSGERTKNWLKLKKDYLNSNEDNSNDNNNNNKLALDSFDLILLAAYYGKGKRKGVYGSFLMGCKNENGTDYRTVCKIGTGFSEQLLLEIYNSLSKNEMKTIDPQQQNIITSDYKIRPRPDVWFEPTEVWEVRAADISLSKVHDSCCHEFVKDFKDVDSSSTKKIKKIKKQGLALRFPRFVRFRHDKNINDATTETQLYDWYTSQKSVQNSTP